MSAGPAANGNTAGARARSGTEPVRFGSWRRPVRLGTASLVLNTRVVLLVLVSLAAVFAAFLLAVSLGKFPVPAADVFSILGGADHGFASKVVLEWRLPRAVAAVTFGAGLGVSGAIFQSLTRNPLGSPDVIGLGAGAFTGALLAVTLTDARWAITVFALAGGAGSGALVYLLSFRRGLSGIRFVIVGIAVSSALTAVNSLLLLRMSTFTATTVSAWGQGTLTDAKWGEVAPVSCAVLALLIAAFALAPALRQLELGDDPAAASGARVEPARLWLLVIGVVLTATVTSITGPIAFVALVAPQLARLLTGGGGATLAGSAATGALLLSVSDVAAAHLFPVSVPVGVVTAVLGGGYLLGLLVREARRT